MVLDFLCLVVVTDLHLLVFETLQLSLKSFLLVSEGLEREDNLFDLPFTLLKHLLEFTDLAV